MKNSANLHLTVVHLTTFQHLSSLHLLTVGDRRVKGRRRSVSRLIGQIMCSKQKVCMWVPLSQSIGPICTPLCARES